MQVTTNETPKACNNDNGKIGISSSYHLVEEVPEQFSYGLMVKTQDRSKRIVRNGCFLCVCGCDKLNLEVKRSNSTSWACNMWQRVIQKKLASFRIETDLNVSDKKWAWICLHLEEVEFIFCAGIGNFIGAGVFGVKEKREKIKNKRCHFGKCWNAGPVTGELEMLTEWSQWMLAP